jgi:hypothetical protein
MGYSNDDNEFSIECLNNDMSIEVDSATLLLFTSGTVRIGIGGTSVSGVLRVTGDGGGTLAEIDGDGNLLIAGTISENHSF